ncbi:MAG TPA: oligosaccharide flippase family protein [Terriglobales bacterium]|jgi:O-antigen/teichoic acid export membrane protein|nr:oligosaccharide flippase family protein [Terriglobales bacterium]
MHLENDQTLEEVRVAPPRAIPDISLGTKIIRNVISGGLRYVFVAPIPFIMTPLILSKIGVRGYGTWAVFLAINGLTSLADLGLVGTLSKFVAEYHAQRDLVAMRRVLNSGLALFLSISAFIGIALWTLAPRLQGLLFRGSPTPSAELVLLFRLFLVVIAANILNLLFSSVTSGLQRLDLTNLISAVNVFLNALFSASLLLAGFGLRGLVYGYAASGVITVAVYLVLVRRLLPNIVLNPLQFDRQEAQKMFSFSFRLYITQAAVAVHNQIEKVFLAMLIGVTPVGWYDIASDISLKLRNAISFVLSPVLPAASELSALRDEHRMRELYYRTHKYLALIGIPAVCFAAGVSRRFVELWLGPQLEIIAFPLSVLLIVSFANLVTGPGFYIFAGQGNLAPCINSAVLGITVNLVLSLGLIYKYGFSGAVLGTSAALILAAGYFLSVFHRSTGYPFLPLLRGAYLKPLLCSFLALAVILALRPMDDLSWLGLATMAAIFGSVYCIVILLSRFFDPYDWSKMESFFPGIRLMRKLWGVG